MKYGIEPFNERSLPDAESVCDDMYSGNVFPLLEKILANPVRKELHVDAAGEIAYQEDVPVAFQAAIVRKLYFGKREFHGVVGSTLCSRPDTSPVLLMKLMKTTIAPRGGGLLFFANTAIPISSKMNRLLGVKGVAPQSCGQVRFDVFRWGAFVKFALKGRLPDPAAKAMDLLGRFTRLLGAVRRKTALQCRKVGKIDSAFDAFWAAYVERNKGVVSSRSSEELKWMFQSRIDAGKAVILSLNDSKSIKGYIVAKVMDGRRQRWQIVDWIAIGDDRSVLGDLLGCMKRYLLRNEPVVWIESIGFPDSIQPLIKRHLPFKRNLKEPVFVYKAFDDEIGNALSSPAVCNWFWGAYDGDRCF